MYAIIRDRNKQYKVKEDAEILVDYNSDWDQDEEVSFEEVLYYHDDDNLEIGQPTIDNANVDAQVVQHEKGEKMVVLKFKRRNRYKRKIGHRQQYTRLKIDNISVEG